MANCRACQAPLVWHVIKGKPHPLDYHARVMVPDEAARGMGYDLANERWRRGRLVETDEEEIVEQTQPCHRVHLSHFATCPAAERFRKRGE